MALVVQKFGGTSVGSPERVRSVAERIKYAVDKGHQVLVTVSAMGDSTDRLVNLSRQVAGQDPDTREMDVLLATGEQVSASLLAMCLQQKGIASRSFLGHQIAINTNNAHGRARIETIETKQLRAALNNQEVAIVAGFQGVNAQGDITTLGRGGTDTTAVALAVVLEADECQIYTDVDGIYTTDPRIEPQARQLDHITFEEMLELSSLGSQVMQTRAMEFASKHMVPIRVLNSFDPEFNTQGKGTLITKDYTDAEAPLVAGITFTRDEAEINLRNVPDEPGIAYRILSPIADAGIEVDMIVQTASRDGDVDFSFTVHRENYQKALSLVEITSQIMPNTDISSNDKVVKLSVVGVGMRSHAGVASTIFEALANESINIRMVSTSEIKVSVLIDESSLETGVRCLHKAFNLAT
ncbi:MAG: aspartate kinase [Gammaproteobacteria bacterium]|nr:aspartate kinase [Gammaproteobacteria bacterium]NNC96610.1 aspartate kinase [Gammaproteobacteria bacterium]NNM12807.1 aspartate kinase [Gammaproteobacteria bacterium]